MAEDNWTILKNWTIEDVLNTMTDREQKVLRLKYGLDDGKPKNLEEICEVVKVTESRLKQIEAKALRKLRHPVRSK